MSEMAAPVLAISDQCRMFPKCEIAGDVVADRPTGRGKIGDTKPNQNQIAAENPRFSADYAP